MFAEKYNSSVEDIQNFNASSTQHCGHIIRMRHLLFQFLCEDVAGEIFYFGGKVNRVSNFEFFLDDIIIRVEPHNVIRLTNGSKNFKNLRDNKWPQSNTIH